VKLTKGVEIKSALLLSLITTNQFRRLDNEDPHNHLKPSMNCWRRN